MKTEKKTIKRPTHITPGRKYASGGAVHGLPTGAERTKNTEISQIVFYFTCARLNDVNYHIICTLIIYTYADAAAAAGQI